MSSCRLDYRVYQQDMLSSDNAQDVKFTWSQGNSAYISSRRFDMLNLHSSDTATMSVRSVLITDGTVLVRNSETIPS
jgi:hypothetical protein